MGHILIVEDEPDIADLFSTHLMAQGHTCDIARDGEEGRALVMGAGTEYDLVFCDLKMRRMGGKDFLKYVHPVLKDRTPVFVVSAWPHLVEAMGVTRQYAFLILNKPIDLAELGEAVARGLEQRALYKRLKQLEGQVEQLSKNNELLLDQSNALYDEVRVDAMTGLPNRTKLEEELDVQSANVGRYRTQFAVAFCDLDDFGRYNNEQSYGVGDAVLRAVAKRLQRASRQGDTVYRYGGDEFVVILAYQQLEEACQAADRFRRGLEEEELDLGGPLGSTRVTISGGVVAVTPDELRPVADLLDEASRLCKEAKAAGGNRIQPCDRDD